MSILEHVEVENHGSIVLVRPLSDAARGWVSENVELEGWQWHGDAFACEPRAFGPMVERMLVDLEGL
jgi:hypothetical protein